MWTRWEMIAAQLEASSRDATRKAKWDEAFGLAAWLLGHPLASGFAWRERRPTSRDASMDGELIWQGEDVCKPGTRESIAGSFAQLNLVNLVSATCFVPCTRLGLRLPGVFVGMAWRATAGRWVGALGGLCWLSGAAPNPGRGPRLAAGMAEIAAGMAGRERQGRCCRCSQGVLGALSCLSLGRP